MLLNSDVNKLNSKVSWCLFTKDATFLRYSSSEKTFVISIALLENKHSNRNLQIIRLTL